MTPATGARAAISREGAQTERPAAFALRHEVEQHGRQRRIASIERSGKTTQIRVDESRLEHCVVVVGLGEPLCR